MSFEIYQDIAQRTNGEIYIGVVGPVRTGKSTFIRNFMQNFVLNNLQDKRELERAMDELPQSGDGKIIMTTEPKFVPNKAVQISVGKNISLKTRMVDCVGYVVDGASGVFEDEKPRMIKTPWQKEAMPFEKAAEMGTKKVIEEHSTIAVVVTCDGSICDIERQNYLLAEDRVIDELKATNKPFIVIMNSTDPSGNNCRNYAQSLEKRKNCKVICADVSKLSPQSVENIFAELLHEFSICRIDFSMPEWFSAINLEGKIMCDLKQELLDYAKDIKKIADLQHIEELQFSKKEIFSPKITDICLGNGVAKVYIEVDHAMFFECLQEITNEEISNEYQIMAYIKNVQEAKKQYAKFKDALQEVMQNGYGVVNPQAEDMILCEPEIVRHGSNFGLRLKASAPSLHIMRVDVNAELNPIVGTQKQGEEMAKLMQSQFENNKSSIWNSNMFGKPMCEMIQDGLSSKMNALPEHAQKKVRKTLTKIINEGKGGMICILL